MRMQQQGKQGGQARSASSGQAIFPLVLVLSAVFGMIAVTFAGVAYLQSLLSSQRAFAEQALQAATSGVDDALLRIARDRTWTQTGPGYTLAVDGITSTIDVASTADCGSAQTCRTVTSEATHRGVTRTLIVVVEVSPSGATRVLSRTEATN